MLGRGASPVKDVQDAQDAAQQGPSYGSKAEWVRRGRGAPMGGGEMWGLDSGGVP